MRRLKYYFVFLQLIAFINVAKAQSILGSWVRIKMETYQGGITTQLEETNKNYLKFHFKDGKNLSISTHYATNSSNSPSTQYRIKNNILEFGFDRKYLIEKIDAINLVIVEFEDGELAPNSIKSIFIREQKYLDKLPLAIEDIIIGKNDTLYIESKKLYPQFKTIDPDFHAHLSNQMNSYYPVGENYFFATFNIHPDGEIDQIKILHHINKSTDKKAMKAIKASGKMWSLPKLNGKKVTIIKFIEDRYVKKRGNDISKISFNKLSHVQNSKYSPEYLYNFHFLARNLLNNEYKKALEFISKLEEIKPNEANLYYLKYLCYLELGDEQKSNENLLLLKKSKLRYLVK
ncbi:hypothetical protein D7030_11080 [Flavobacteriaceae bacterium AU392]|nr:hypothetical protein D1817_13590 [Flavobacteriaceae bacterium]RKM82703.1 hypothetical protein D7030_11080 [Flavobacteriaceae bacterium AU392]